MEFDLFTLLPLAAAVFVFWKLRGVLGSRDGAQPPSNYNPYETGESDRRDGAIERRRAEAESATDNVVTLPGMQREEIDPGEAIRTRIDEIAGKDKKLKKGLLAIADRDPAFDPDEFQSGARIAYEMIVTGFAEGDKRALKNLLSREVFENFEEVIDARADRGERVQSSFVGIEKAEFVAAEVAEEEAQITMRFVSQLISATLDRDDEVIEGDLKDVAETIDVWTFARPVKSRDPNWKLVATGA